MLRSVTTRMASRTGATRTEPGFRRKNEDEDFRTRNYAIWSLGQLGDKQALPALEKFYTGNIPEREPYDEGISQYELKKAIALLQGGANVTAVVWRRGEAIR